MHYGAVKLECKRVEEARTHATLLVSGTSGTGSTEISQRDCSRSWFTFLECFGIKSTTTTIAWTFGPGDNDSSRVGPGQSFLPFGSWSEESKHGAPALSVGVFIIYLFFDSILVHQVQNLM